jgi:hypothetical protein
MPIDLMYGHRIIVQYFCGADRPVTIIGMRQAIKDEPIGSAALQGCKQRSPQYE